MRRAGEIDFARELNIATQNINAAGVVAMQEVRTMPDRGVAALADSAAYVAAIRQGQHGRRNRR
jgi:hypothetical protein